MKIVDRSLSLGKIKGKVDWNERNKLVLSHVAPSLENLQAKFDEDRTSIGLIKPAEVLEFYKKEILGYMRPKSISTIPFRDEDSRDWELLESYRRWGKLW